MPVHSSQQEECRQEYDVIRAAFIRLVLHAENSAESLALLEDVISLRASFLIDKALKGLRMDLDRALEILRNYNDFSTEREKHQRNVLVAAVDNLIDFAVAEEFAMMQELPDELDSMNMEDYEAVCEKYNLTYAREENSTVLFAAGMAAWWLTIDSETIITFMTQEDERVRPWHEALNGLSFQKQEFPPELIPPIEWGCRCFLSANGFGSVYGAIRRQKRLPEVNPVFAESLAVDGCIFSLAHPYFQNKIPRAICEIGERIKLKYGLPCLK